jgi:hypothetical protein
VSARLAVAIAGLVIVEASMPACGRAQALVSVSSASLAVAAPTEAQYDAGGPTGSTGSYTITTTCAGSGPAHCRLFLQYGTNSQGQQVGTQWALTSATPAAACTNLPALNVFQDVVAATVVLTALKNLNCIATFIFRVNPLSYTIYQSPGPVSGAYKQQIQFVLTRP